MNYTLEQITELAKEVELGDGINWDNLNVERDRIYQIIASQVYEMYHTWGSADDKEAIMLATITKLVVENFILNLKLESQY